MKHEINNILHECECGCKTPVIEESIYEKGQYRIVCPDCKNGEELYFIDSLPGCIMAWNNAHWKWTV